jgi:hypothetical protein
MLLLAIACSTTRAPLPVVSDVRPALLCGVEPKDVVVEGSGFSPVAADVLVEPHLALPTLELARAGDIFGNADGDEEVFTWTVGESLRWVDANTLELRTDPLPPGAWDAQVTNPDGGVGALPAALVWTAPPRITALAPADVCVDTVGELRVEGTGFAFADAPVVTVGGVEVTGTLEGCTALAGGHGTSCEAILVPLDGLAIGDMDVTVTTIDSCTTTATLRVAAPPVIDAVAPSTACGTPAITLTGTGFPADPIVTIGGVAATVDSANPAEVVVTPGPGTPTGDVEVVLSSLLGCTASTTMTLVDAPELWFVDPGVVPAGRALAMTVWVSDVSADISEVWVDDGSGPISLAFTWDDRVIASLPDTLPAGTYTVGIEQTDGCGGALADALVVSDTATVAIEALEPAYAWEWDDTPVQITATDPLPAGMVGFDSDVRLYLSARAGGSAAAVRALTRRTETLLTATIPAGLEPGAYDVFAVNPDGTLGVLESGLTVTEERPPVIDSVSPPGLINTRSETVTIRGSSFRDPSVAVTCREGGIETTVAATVTASTSTTTTALVPSDDFGQAVCVVELTNADGPSARWAALSIRSPSENLFPWAAGTELVVARRAPAGAAARTSSVERWVYALGGDDGDPASPLDSVERAFVDVYGDPGEWALISPLPSPLTRASAVVIGEFVYVVGGDDGTGLVAGGWRAHVLDPLATPRFDTLSIDAGGLGPGRWSWRIAAIYASDDPTNPDGESLPSDPIVVTLPDVGGLGVDLAWEPMVGAVGYRVYRSPTAGDTDEEWVGDTTDTHLFDDGLPTTPDYAPLAAGALGAWVALPALDTPRAGACAAIASDPEPDPVRVYLYVAGGEDAAGDPLDTVEVLDVVIVAPAEHQDGAWADAGVTLTDPRSGCGAWTVDAARHSVVDAETTWLYFGGGEGPSRTVGTVDAGLVGSGGVFDEWTEIDSMSPARAGYGAAAGSNFLYAFGGSQGAPSTSGVSAELGDDPMPEVHNWNNLGTSLAEARVYPGSAQESAVIFVFGGETDTAAASRSVDVTNW